MMPFPIAGDSEYGLDPFVWGAGGEIATEQRRQVDGAIDSPAGAGGHRVLHRPRAEGRLLHVGGATWSETDLLDSFRRQGGMMIAGNWTPNALVEAEPRPEGQDRRLPDPGQERRHRARLPRRLAPRGVQDSKNQDLAWEFVKMMTHRRPRRQVGRAGRLLPRHQTPSSRVQQAADPLVAPFAKQMVEAGRAVPVRRSAAQSRASRPSTTMLQSILTGEPAVADATARRPRR